MEPKTKGRPHPQVKMRQSPQIAKPQSPDPQHFPKEFMNIALKRLSVREYGVEELRALLLRRGADDSTALQVIEELKRRDWLSDERFIQSFVRAYHGRNRGPKAIAFELKKRNIDVSPDAIERHLAELRPESETIEHLVNWVQRRYQRDLSNPESCRSKLRAKMMRAILSRGFGTDLAAQVLKRVSWSASV